mmetsp:Transcript_69714/g.215546  ORF Transcript_69714/g.215546 Transcript_69714/m.215546 type:complete len:231 (+) Transcript_69714:527-1219(+)
MLRSLLLTESLFDLTLSTACLSGSRASTSRTCASITRLDAFVARKTEMSRKSACSAFRRSSRLFGMKDGNTSTNERSEGNLKLGVLTGISSTEACTAVVMTRNCCSDCSVPAVSTTTTAWASSTASRSWSSPRLPTSASMQQPALVRPITSARSFPTRMPQAAVASSSAGSELKTSMSGWGASRPQSLAGEPRTPSTRPRRRPRPTAAPRRPRSTSTSTRGGPPSSSSHS